jgi:hypothetical protein
MPSDGKRELGDGLSLRRRPATPAEQPLFRRVGSALHRLLFTRSSAQGAGAALGEGGLGPAEQQDDADHVRLADKPARRAQKPCSAAQRAKAGHPGKLGRQPSFTPTQGGPGQTAQPRRHGHKGCKAMRQPARPPTENLVSAGCQWI